MPIFFDDPEDGMTRRYSRLIKTTNDALPSFSWAIIDRVRTAKTAGLAPSYEKCFVRYTGLAEKSQRTNLHASALLELSKAEGWPGNNPLKGKIVLLGGTYGDDDLHYTPVGRMYGVQVIAQLLETELQGGGDKARSPLTIILLELFECVLVILLFHAYDDENDYTRAEPLLQRTLAIREQVLGPEHPDVARVLNNLAALYVSRGDYARAEFLFQRALAIQERVLGPEHRDVELTLRNLASLYEAKNDWDQAILLETRANEITEKSLALVLTTGSETQKRLYMATLSGETKATISLHLQAAPNNTGSAASRGDHHFAAERAHA